MSVNGCSFSNDQSIMNPLSAAHALGKTPIFKEPRLIGDWGLWLEQRPEERGRTTALIRPWGRPDLPPQELTPCPINLRTRVHAYGGGAVASAYSGNEMVISWIDDCDGCLCNCDDFGLGFNDPRRK